MGDTLPAETGPSTDLLSRPPVPNDDPETLDFDDSSPQENSADSNNGDSVSDTCGPNLEAVAANKELASIMMGGDIPVQKEKLDALAHSLDEKMATNSGLLSARAGVSTILADNRMHAAMGAKDFKTWCELRNNAVTELTAAVMMDRNLVTGLHPQSTAFLRTAALSGAIANKEFAKAFKDAMKIPVCY